MCLPQLGVADQVEPAPSVTGLHGTTDRVLGPGVQVPAEHGPRFLLRSADAQHHLVRYLGPWLAHHLVLLGQSRPEAASPQRPPVGVEFQMYCSGQPVELRTPASREVLGYDRPGSELAQSGPGSSPREEAIGNAAPVARSGKGTVTQCEQVPGKALFGQPVEVMDSNGNLIAKKAGRFGGYPVLLLEAVAVERPGQGSVTRAGQSQLAHPAVIAEIPVADYGRTRNHA